MIHLLPQLPCKNRYSEDWIEIWERELDKLSVDFDTLKGYEKAVAVTKYFTDPNKALTNECNQIKVLAKSNPEKVFCLDIDFPGLLTAAIPVLKLINPVMEFYGYLHAGSWCNGDIFRDGDLAKPLQELSAFAAFDKVFVATNYHLEKIEKYFHFITDNYELDAIEVVGFPFYKEDVLEYVDNKVISYEEKKRWSNYILINGRPEQSDMKIVDKLVEVFPNEEFRFVKAKNRKEYYELLNQAKIVISLKTEETFGISQLEAYVLGSIPLCPNDFSYPEVIQDERLLYNDEKDLIKKLDYLLTLEENPFTIDIEKYRHTIAKCMEFTDKGY